MRRSVTGAALLLLAACGDEARRDNAAGADIGAVAAEAQGDIDTYAANRIEPAPATVEAAAGQSARPVAAASPEPVESRATAQAATPEAPDIAAPEAVPERCVGETRVTSREDRADDDAAAAPDVPANDPRQSGRPGIWQQGPAGGALAGRDDAGRPDAPPCVPR